jgi:UDP-N-acetylmuramoylalanine--D-glutamate ligase
VTPADTSAAPWLVLGLGVTGQAVLRGLVARGERAVAVDDGPTEAGRSLARELGVDLVEAPDADRLAALVRSSGAVVPSPGVPDHHPVFRLAASAGVAVRSEFDLATRWDPRPLLAVTGTDGKTTVVTLVTAMLAASGLRAVAAGNTEVPLVAAIEDPRAEVFVVEASSFRLLHSERFAPSVATWLNLGADHLDAHATLADYEAAKARIWAHQGPDQVAVGNADDPVVARHLAAAPARQVSFGLTPDADHHVADGHLVVPGGERLLAVEELPRAFPHDLANALAATATALEGGATLDGVRAALRAFRGLPHRVTLVGEAGGVTYYDDSKATTPHAALAAIGGFESVVLIAGGRNKGLDLGTLREGAERIRSVVAIGEAADEVAAAFDGVRPVRLAASMDDAVLAASKEARPGDAVLLSPACASFDRYPGYAARGDDFARAVTDLISGPDQTPGASP